MNTLSVVIPCYNEERTLEACVREVLKISDEQLKLEIIIVDDCSRDKSRDIARRLAEEIPEIQWIAHERNSGKGAALRTGFSQATGDFVAIQDADLEYDPKDLRRLVEPLASGTADVVFGSRYHSASTHRVLYFWHSLGNRFLTFLSNMFTDLDLSDMETCYKVFRRDVIQSIQIEEDRFGFEPEIVAKIAAKKLRIYEMGISYFGRTYDEGKKIGMRDGWRALYCIFRYNAHRSPAPIQFLCYLIIGALAGSINLAVFISLYLTSFSISASSMTAYILAAGFNYYLCVHWVFRHTSLWSPWGEWLFYGVAVLSTGFIDLWITQTLIGKNWTALSAKITACLCLPLLNFVLRKYLLFFEKSTPG